MKERALGDPELFPSDEVLAAHLGRSMAAFSAMLERNRSKHPDFQERWKYYNDGKSWLFNVSRKKKTLFWLSVEEGGYRVTFYLSPAGGEALLGSSLPEGLKGQYRAAEGKKFRGVTLEVKAKKDLEAYEGLLAIKMASQ
jgi:hypothetical protein